MNFKFYTADVFTDKPFHGAQIAVFPHAEGLDDPRMQLIARELSLPGTVFVFPSTNTNCLRRLRIFTPLAEENLVGHPIVAAAHVLATLGEVELVQRHTAITLEQNIGPIRVYITQDQGRPVLIQFTLKTRAKIDRFTPPAQELAEILSLGPHDFAMRKYTPLLVSCGYPYMIVPLRSYAAVRQARFNFNAWSQSSAPSTFFQEILLFSRQSALEHSDFHGRLVGPKIGVNEDPPIASCMPAFAHYLCTQSELKPGTYTFMIDRGEPTRRQSVLHVEMDNKQMEELTIRVGGPAVMMSEGQMRVSV